MTKSNLCSLFLFFTIHITYAERLAKIIYFQAPTDAPKAVFVHQGNKKPEEIELKSRRFSASFTIAKGAQRVYFLPQELATGAKVPLKSPHFNVPEDWSKVLFFVSEDRQNPIMPIKVHAVDASDDVFSPGEFLFVNQSSLMVGGKIGTLEVKMKARSLKTVESPLKERGIFNVILDSYNPNTKQRRNLIRKKWIHVPQFRNVLFITDLPPPKMAKLFVAEIRSF